MKINGMNPRIIILVHRFEEEEKTIKIKTKLIEGHDTVESGSFLWQRFAENLYFDNINCPDAHAYHNIMVK